MKIIYSESKYILCKSLLFVWYNKKNVKNVLVGLVCENLDQFNFI